MMLGSNECEGIPYGNPDDAYWTSEPTTAAELRTRVKQIVSVDDAEADRLIALYKFHRPNDSFGDLAAVMSGDNSALRTSAYAIAERQVRTGSRAGVSLLLQLAFTRAQRQAAHDARHGTAVRIRPPRQDLVHDRRRFGPRRNRDRDEQHMGGIRPHRQSQSLRDSSVGSVQPHHLADDGLR